MKNITLISAFILLCALQSSAQGEIIANINNLKNDNGVCRACLFNKNESLKTEAGGAVVCLSAGVKNKTSKVIFRNVPVGNYAVIVFHDENSNSKIDKNFLGIPKEGYGASKNKLPFASAPAFKPNSFLLTPHDIVTLDIRLRYL